MTRPAAAVLAFALSVLAAGCALPGGPPPEPTEVPCVGGTVYENVDRTWGVCVPAGWEGHPHHLGRELFILAPLEGEEDPFRESVNLGRQRVGENVTLDPLVDEGLAGLAQRMQNFTVLAREPAQLDGVAALRIAYEGEEGGVAVWATQTIAIRDGVAVSIVYTALRGHQAVFAAPAAAVTASFRFLDMGPKVQ